MDYDEMIQTKAAAVWPWRHLLTHVSGAEGSFAWRAMKGVVSDRGHSQTQKTEPREVAGGLEGWRGGIVEWS